MESSEDVKSSKKLVMALLLTGLANFAVQMLQVHKYSYDAYTHIFFADHYKRNWFSLWDSRWYGGFSVTTYPPLAHQLIAIIGFMLDIEVSYQVISVILTLVLTYSIYLYSKIFIGEGKAQYAAIIASFLPATGIILNAFGQLPTVLSTALSLVAAYSFDRYLSVPSTISLFRAVLWTALSGFAHHFTLVFFVPFIILPVIIKNIGLGLGLIKRMLIYGLFSLILLTMVLKPFIIYALNHPGWEEIPHATRNNLFTSPDYAFPFFWGIYSFTIFLLPNAFLIAFRDRAIRPLLVIYMFFFITGLGGTTPLPRILFGYLWRILTYDRFAFWAAVTYVPFLAIMVSEAGTFIEKYYYGKISNQLNKRVHNLLLTAMVFSLAISFTLTSFGNVLIKPAKNLSNEQLRILAEFLDSNSEWKYITLGLGGQRLLLSSMTVAPMFDGGYNLAKTLPIFTKSGVDNVDAAKFLPNGINLLKEIIISEASNGLKYVLSADEYYAPILRDLGLRITLKVEGDMTVEIWEAPYALRMTPVSPPHADPFTLIMWTLMPITCLAVALFLELSNILLKLILTRSCRPIQCRHLLPFI